MANQTTDWKAYLLGALFTITIATTGYGVNSNENRIAKIEHTLDVRAPLITEYAARMALVEQAVIDIKVSINKMDANQEKLVTKMDALVNTMLRDSRRWNEEMDRLTKGRK